MNREQAYWLRDFQPFWTTKPSDFKIYPTKDFTVIHFWQSLISSGNPAINRAYWGTTEPSIVDFISQYGDATILNCRSSWKTAAQRPQPPSQFSQQEKFGRQQLCFSPDQDYNSIIACNERTKGCVVHTRCLHKGTIPLSCIETSGILLFISNLACLMWSHSMLHRVFKSILKCWIWIFVILHFQAKRRLDLDEPPTPTRVRPSFRTPKTKGCGRRKIRREMQPYPKSNFLFIVILLLYKEDFRLYEKSVEWFLHGVILKK